METTTKSVKTTAELIREVRDLADCGMLDAKRAIELRDGCVTCAVEWVARTGLAVVMSDEARYPLWHSEHGLPGHDPNNPEGARCERCGNGIGGDTRNHYRLAAECYRIGHGRSPQRADGHICGDCEPVIRDGLEGFATVTGLSFQEAMGPPPGRTLVNAMLSRTQLADERKLLITALEEILALVGDRERFVMRGAAGFAEAAVIAQEALDEVHASDRRLTDNRLGHIESSAVPNVAAADKECKS